MSSLFTLVVGRPGPPDRRDARAVPGLLAVPGLVKVKPPELALPPEAGLPNL